MTGSTLDSPVPKHVRAQQIPYFFRSPYTTTALSDLHYPFNNQNAGYPKLYQNSKNSHELSSSIFLQMHTYHISLTHPLHLILSRLLQEIRRSISESASNSRLKPRHGELTDSTCDGMKNCHTHTHSHTYNHYVCIYIHTLIYHHHHHRTVFPTWYYVIISLYIQFITWFPTLYSCYIMDLDRQVASWSMQPDVPPHKRRHAVAVTMDNGKD